MDQQVAPIPVFRPPFLTDGGEFRGSLIEAPANIFYQQVKASRATLNRMQFQWRSVSDSLLLSPTVRLQCPQMWTQLLSYASVEGILQYASDEDGVYAANGGTAQAAGAASHPPVIVFADGDAFTSCCSSMNLVFNGTSVSLNRCNYFWRDYLRTQVSSADAARIYKSAGGSYDHYDQTPVIVSTVQAVAAGTSVGITQDTGINERSKTLYSLINDAGAATAAGTAFSRIVQISVPIPLPPFNPWRGYALPASSPYTKCPLAIPHLSAGGLDFLLEDFATAFIRRLGKGGIHNAVAAIGTGGGGILT